MDAAPLTNEQQLETMTQRLGAEDAALLMHYITEKMPTCQETGMRITALPPVLAVVMSIFEGRRGQAMPSTACEVYNEIVKELVEPSQLPLLRAVFFSMHVTMCRVGMPEKVEAAAQMLGLSEAQTAAALASFKEGSVPFIKMTKTPPAFVHAHISIQEFLTADAICEGVSLADAPPPWEWPAWWAGALWFGAEMGPTFGRGLVKAAGVDLDGAIDLSGKLGGDTPTVVRALSLMMAGLKSLNLQGNSLPEDAKEMLKQAAYGRVELQL